MPIAALGLPPLLGTCPLPLAQIVLADTVVVEDQLERVVRDPQDLAAKARMLLNFAYDCQPLMSQGSIFRCCVGHHCTRRPLKNQGVLEDTKDGW